MYPKKKKKIWIEKNATESISQKFYLKKIEYAQTYDEKE